MNIIFIHQNFPGQFRHLAGHLADNPKNRVVAICQPHAPRLPKVRNTLVYKPSRKPAPTTHHYLRNMEEAVLNGQAVAKVLLRLQKQGFTPDLVVAHPGWGEALYVKDVFPETPLLSFFEFYYHAKGADAGFDPEFPLTMDGRTRIRTRNALHLLNLAACDAGISPTRWQKNLHPAEFHSKISVLHEGVDTRLAVPNPSQRFTLPDGKVLTRSDEVITYVARNLEPYRGFHIFMRAAAEICKRRPNCRIVIAGGDEVSYGVRLPHGKTYREKMLEEVAIDPERVIFTGILPYLQYLALLQVSSAHVYLTVPFVLSWSILEAMSAGCLVIGSSTLPVEEVVRHGENGLLVDFFSPTRIADAVDEVLAHPDRMQGLREAARRTIVEQYDVREAIAKYLKLIHGDNNNGLLGKFRNPSPEGSASGHAAPNKPYAVRMLSRNQQHLHPLREARGSRSTQRDVTVLSVPATIKGNHPILFAVNTAAPDAGITLKSGAELDDVGLTPREAEILRHIALGRSDKEISAKLKISVKTTGHHAGNIICKLEAENRTHAVAKALQTKLIKIRATDAARQANLKRRASDQIETETVEVTSIAGPDLIAG